MLTWKTKLHIDICENDGYFIHVCRSSRIFVLRIYIIYLTNKKMFNILATFIGKY